MLHLLYQTRKIAGCACAGLAGNVSPPTRVSDPDMHHGTCVTHVPWCLPESLTSGFLWSRWRGKRCRHSRCKRNPQFYVSGKRPMHCSVKKNCENTARAICTYINIYTGENITTMMSSVIERSQILFIFRIRCLDRGVPDAGPTKEISIAFQIRLENGCLIFCHIGAIVTKS